MLMKKFLQHFCSNSRLADPHFLLYSSKPRLAKVSSYCAIPVNSNDLVTEFFTEYPHDDKTKDKSRYRKHNIDKT